MSFERGNKKDGRHYWLTPPALMADLQLQFNFDFDPCPFPVPADFDGLQVEWGMSNYVNPPFGGYRDRATGKKKGPTAWARKALKEFEKGKRVVLVYPMDNWVMMLLQAGAKITNLGDVRWCSIEDGVPGRGVGKPTACFVLEPEGFSIDGQLKNILSPVYTAGHAVLF